MKRVLSLLFVLGLCHSTFATDLAHELCLQSTARFALPSDSPDYRKYAPDRSVDILNLSLDITPDFKKRTINGSAKISFTPIGKPLEELKLDAVELRVSNVVSTEKIAGYQVTDKAIVVTFEKPVQPGKQAEVTISYSAQPDLGLYFRTPEMGYLENETELWTQGELMDHRYWYPSHDFPNEKFSSEVTCHVPEGMTVLSNGKLVGETKDSNGLVAVHWRQEKPHVNYLVTLVAGHFKKIEDKYGDLPLAFYVPPSEIKEAQNSFRTTKDTMSFLEKEIGIPYPWEKYYQVVVRDFVAGGMENTSVTTLTDRTLFSDEFENARSSEGLVAHELAHQWFGDLVTCKDWSHTWLNEGFATYYALLYDEHKNGRDSMLYGLWQSAKGITGNTNEPRGIVYRKYEKPTEQFGYLSYQKGAWVLHTLRSELGEDIYRKGINAYLKKYQFETVVTENLNASLEEVSGRSLDRFFDQWVYNAGNPELKVEYSWDEKTKLARLSVEQMQKITETVALFDIPLTFRFHTKSGDKDESVHLTQKSEDFYFSLSAAPEYVIVDPELALLAKVEFKPPTPMLYAQLDDDRNVIGQLSAAEQLGNKKDHQTVEKLKHALNSAKFYGVRIEAAKALQAIHNDEALAALIDSAKQKDARARKQVVASIGGFFDEKALKFALDTVEREKNPDVAAQALKTFGTFSDGTATLTNYLASKSYRNVLADAAITAIRSKSDPKFIPALKSTLETRESAFTTRSFAGALDALAYIARNEDDKDEVRNFLLKYVNHKKEGIRVGAINALGTLEDPQAISVLETFASAAKETPERTAAEKALATIRAAKRSVDNLSDLRAEILSIKEQQREAKKEVEALKKKTEISSPKRRKQ